VLKVDGWAQRGHTFIMNHLWGQMLGHRSVAATLSLLTGLGALSFSACVDQDSAHKMNRSTASAGAADVGDGVERAFTSLISKDDISMSVGTEVTNNRFPTESQFEVGSIPITGRVQYAFEPEAQAYMEKLLTQYRPDYGVFVAMDAKTGRILTMASRTQGNANAENLALKATFPSASIFKVVTAGAVLDTDKVNPNTRIAFNGASHTLYRRNVIDTKENKWTRRMTIREAFGSSVNTIFGKLGLFYAGPETLRAYAERFHFNHPIRADVPIQTGYSRFTSDDPWSVVAAASGFTLDNTMSPVQGAMIAAAVANDGVMMEPFIVDSVTNVQGEPIYQASPKRASIVVGPETARQLRELFEQTVHSGTSRKAFRQALRARKFETVEFGGKTGSLTGLNPKGKCDWFIGYARFGDRRVAVAALTVNQVKWRVKSSTLAQLFLTDYVKSHTVSVR
jgi:penicillin-binding protein A